MIYVEMAGRCGNQMFHYACARAISIATKDQTLILNYNKIMRGEAIDYLKDFNVCPYQVYNKPGTVIRNETNILQLILCCIKGIQIKLLNNKTRQEKANGANFFQHILNLSGVYWIREGTTKFCPYPRKKKIVSGICESPCVFENIRSVLLEEFKPNKPIAKKNEIFYKEIIESASVCVSVRRGDFLSEKNAKSFSVCTKNYYLNARKIIEQKVENPTFFVFSDDINWCKKELWDDENTVYIPQNMQVYETLFLMYTCKHFIISNSTFSWWGQYLSQNNDKLVISPSRWNNDGFHSLLISDKWILIDT